MLYGALEFAYAERFANALVDDPAFCRWVLRQTKFAAFAEGSRVLCEEMRKKRSKTAATWWRSHYAIKCACQGCGGRETDILAIFASGIGSRFALHCEVKQPADGFAADKDQAGNYALRAACWTKGPPTAILPHSDAATVLLCSASKLRRFKPHADKFGTVLTFEAIRADFPHATVPESGG